MVEHVDIADGERHEPKGISTATSGDTYVSDGAASGAWVKPKHVLNVKIEDVSTASSAWVVSPFTGTITNIYSVIDGVIATANAVLTSQINGTPVTGGALTIAQSGSAAGDVDATVPTAANAVLAGEAIEIQTNGASTNTVSAVMRIVVQGA